MSSPDLPTVRSVVARAARAPSLHNSQPWRWRWDGTDAELFLAADRLLPATDAFNRQGMLACGVMLDHATVAWAAAGWEVRVTRFPEPIDRSHVASLRPVRRRVALEPDQLLAAAIDARYTDRMVMAAPEGWPAVEVVLDHLCRRHCTSLLVLDEGRSRELAKISQVATGLRRYDPRYQSELAWWTAGSEGEPGIPVSTLPTAQQRPRVASGRTFPAGTADSGSDVDDRATVLILSSVDDSPDALVECGAALSAVLLECTVQELSTCTLTHMTELPAARSMLVDLTGETHPQVLIRVGRPLATPPPRTSRRSIDEILEVVGRP
ncbi:Acg family FMN-binding oxidoreductase [Nocardia cyriacigeorgica]|uniref:NAD(P)H nitroreductase RV3131/MT3217 n=1 Tax=Nocardia cyriacigeorgica TaxID=135487 RepID=A0A4U8W8P5_9NOCA|nr:hypothetical protein [Nocardia cyriacigeorgica]VFA98048.1 Putative NAD(P)H nitroreductase RV3131/MT3217 [Nocardia cyriacigeorgica]